MKGLDKGYQTNIKILGLLFLTCDKMVEDPKLEKLII